MKRFKKYRLLFLSLSILFLAACEDEIDVDLDEGETQLVLDAFITNDSSLQTLRLSETAPYFLNQPTKGVSGAQIKIIGPNQLEYNFSDMGNGIYSYNPNIIGAIDSVGFNYQLQLIYDSEVFIANSRLNPVPPIDSMTYDFEESDLGSEEGYYTQFWARDIIGRSDFYWIRAYKNGEPVRADDPSSLILSEDAAFSGNGADGFIFILPLRAAITNNDEPFALGDTSQVELLSLNEDVFEYLDQVTIQANNGGLFSTPPANIRSNVRDAAGNLQEKVLGVFSLSAISQESIIIE